MKKHVLFSIIVLFFAARATAAITISLVSPASNYTVVSTKLYIAGYVKSTYQVTSVTATIGAVTDTPVFVKTSGLFSESFSLASFHEGDTLNLVITVTDYFNNTASQTIKIIYDNPPVLAVALPVAGAVARPTLPLSIYCRDADSCILNVFYRGSQFFSTKVKDSFNTNLNLSAFKDSGGAIEMELMDKRGQISWRAEINNIYTEKSALLSHYYIYPYAGNWVDEYKPAYNPFIFNGSWLLPQDKLIAANIATGVNDTLSLDNITEIVKAVLTPNGVVYAQPDGTIYRWYAKTDTTTTTGKLFSYNGPYHLYYFDVNSNYWLTYNSDLYRLTLHNIATGQNTILNWPVQNYYVVSFSVALNGVSAGILNKLDQIHNRTSANYAFLAKPNGQVFMSDSMCNIHAIVATDGNNVVYTGNTSVRVFDGTTDTALYNYSPGQITYGVNYLLCNKFIAYCKPDIANQAQVWLRDSMGNNTQLTFYGTSSRLDNIDSNGNVIFIHGGHRYFAARNGRIIEISSPNGQTIYSNGRWYLMLGREIFKINTDGALPLTLLSFNAQKGTAENLLTWATANETNFSYFGVENSTTGVAFTQIGKVQPKGAGTYQFTHVKPAAAINYYRLKLQDKDGRFTYSPVRSINNLGSISIQLSPNPVADVLKLNIAGNATQNLQVVVTDMLGKPVITKQLMAAPGTTVQQLNISQLSKGSYVVKVITRAGDATSYKFIKE